MSKFEKLIEYVVNEDMEKARELMHDICVEKSREIYENLLDEEELDEAVDAEEEAEDEELDEAVDAEEEGEDEDLDESFLDEEDDDFSSDLAADDAIGDIEADEAGMAMEDNMEGEDLEDRVVDLEDALDELEAKFAEVVDGGEYGDEEGDEDEDMGMEFDDEEGDDEEGDEEMDMDMDMDSEEDEEMEETFVREYTEKVAPVKGEANKDHGPVAKSGKGSMQTKGKMSDNPTPKVEKGDDLDTRTVGKKGPQAAPKAVSKDEGAGHGPVAKGRK